ncbi:MAG: hypothetical protein JST67_08160 [Bacteroidetes bacterium]|nr:hypothetical protein [Bacteroidota bacterium]
MKANATELAQKKEPNTTRKILLGIFLFSLLLYSNSFKNNYALDDDYVTITDAAKMTGNARVAKGIKGIPKIFTTHYVENAQQRFEYRPLPMATFAIEYQFFKSNPHVSHFVNALLYAFTCMLLFVVLHRIFKEYHIAFPLLITVLFAAHPIHTEVVNNIKCRDELMAFLLGLCAVYFSLQAAAHPGKKIRYVVFAVLCLLLALLCKKTTILFLYFIPITLWFFYPIQTKKYLWVVGAAVLTMLLYKVFRAGMLHGGTTALREFAFFENPLHYDKSFSSRCLLSLYTCGFYLKLFLIPYPLSCYYGYNTMPAQWASPLVWGSFLLYAAAGLYALYALRKKTLLSYMLLVYLLGVLPFSNFIDPTPGMAAERFVYFGSLGFCMLLVYGFFVVFKLDIKNKKAPSFHGAMRWTFVLLLLLFSGFTFSRNTEWRDELTLFRTDTSRNENSCNLHYMLGNALFPFVFETNDATKKYELQSEATMHYRKTVQLMLTGTKQYPKDYTTISNIGTIYVNALNNLDSAQYFFKKSLAVNSNDYMTNINNADCFLRRGLTDSSISAYKKVIEKWGMEPNLYFKLHDSYWNKKEYHGAVLWGEKAAAALPMPYKLQAYLNLGNAYAAIYDTLRATNSFQSALKLDSTNIELKKEIARVTQLLLPSPNKK